MRYLPRFVSLVALLFVFAISFTQGTPVAAATSLTLPAGFVDETLYSGLLAPRTFAFLPDGRVLATERGGTYMGGISNDQNLASIRVFKNGALLPTRAWQTVTCGDSERGLLGLAIDPNFATNGYIYIYYTRQATSGDACGYNTFANGNVGGPRNRISRLTMGYQGNPDVVDPTSEKVLIDSIPSEVGYHNAGDLNFGLDGYLYASAGNGGVPAASPSTGVLGGKILRIKPTAAGGYTTTGNPYDTTGVSCSQPYAAPYKSSPCKEIFAKGLRNPFRFTIEPSMTGVAGAGLPFVGDVGDGAWEEIDQVKSGGDYGYPVREGPCPAGVGPAQCPPPYPSGGVTAGYQNPVYSYPHVNMNANVDSAVIGGDFYTGGANYPATYVNSYFFVEFEQGWVGRLTYNASTGGWTRQADFATGNQSIVKFRRGPDGNLYYLTFLSDSSRIDAIHRIRYTGSGNKSPLAEASVNPQGGDLSTVYSFSAEGSSDPDNNTPLKYHWDFGDGTSTDTQNLTVTHTYASLPPDGSYTASLTVTDSGNPPATSIPATVNVFVGNAPPTGDIVLTNLTDNSRTASLTYYAGDIWEYEAVNVSDDDTAHPPTVSWSIVFHHQMHTHPFIPSASGTSGQFTIPNTGELDPVVWYRVHLYITDSAGQVTEVIKDVNPIHSNLTFETNPTGGKVIIAGASFATPLTITRVVGMKFDLNVASPQPIWNIPFIFNNWSQGGAQDQTLTVPPTDTTYTATFNAPLGVAPPKNYFITNTPTLTWNRVSWATSYVVQIADNALFTGATVYPASNNLSLTVPTALKDGLHYWRVAPCAAGTCGSYGATDTFVVDVP